jgi:hypothetical protein
MRKFVSRKMKSFLLDKEQSVCFGGVKTRLIEERTGVLCMEISFFFCDLSEKKTTLPKTKEP